MGKLINIYRMSEESAGYKKIKPHYVNNKNCLQNFINVFGKEYLFVFLDNGTSETENMIKDIYGSKPIPIKCGSSAASFKSVYNWALNNFDDNDIIYFVESDYIHRHDSKKVLLEGIEMGTDFATLYLHPDKFINAKDGGNPEIEGGGEISQVFKTATCWWMLTGSTTMTFAATIKNLKENSYIIKKHTAGTYPTDYQMFCDLRSLGKTLIAPIPSYSTHGETHWLSNPSEGNEDVLSKWEKIIQN